jgi:predicted Zn-dependent protease
VNYGKRMAIIALTWFLMVVFSGCYNEERYLFGKRYSEEELAQLEEKAREIDKMDAISAREYVSTYFHLGDAYYNFDHVDWAIKVYRRGLRLECMNCEYQLKLAILEFRGGMRKAAQERFAFVAENSNDGGLRRIARKYLEKCESEGVEDHEITLPDKSDYKIYLTRFGCVSPKIISVLRSRIYQEFKISVDLSEIVFEPDDTAKRSREEFIYDWIIESYGRYESEEKRRERFYFLGISNPENLTKDEKENLARAYLEGYLGEFAEWEKLKESIGSDQYDAHVLMDLLKTRYEKELRDGHVLGVLAVTEADLFGEDYNFVFGWAKRGVGVISYARFKDDDVVTDATIKRIVMQAFSSLGFIIGIPRCSTPQCARAFPMSLAEHDQKMDHLCQECLQNLKARYETLP